METLNDSLREIYEVEKIINCKIYKNKKYYLIKWLCYPINESTWEPISNLTHLNYMIEEFEDEYPFSVDKHMYQIYCEEIKRKIRHKGKNKTKRTKDNISNMRLLSKKKKIESFTKSELKNTYLDKLKIHLHLNLAKRHIKPQDDELIIDLSSSTSESEEMSLNEDYDEQHENTNESKININQLIMPQME